MSGGPSGSPHGPGGEAPQRRRPLLVTAIPLLALVGLLAWVTINSLETEGGSSQGPRPGSQMPPFAAPLALSGPDSDVNVATRAGEGATRPACDVRGPGILNSCDLVRRRPAALAFVAAGNQRCADGFTTLTRAARGTGVQPAAVIVRGSRQEARQLVSSRSWKGPVAWDRDGVLANLYGVAVCPQVVYIRRGGVVAQVRIGTVPAATLRKDLRQLARSGS